MKSFMPLVLLAAGAIAEPVLRRDGPDGAVDAVMTPVYHGIQALDQAVKDFQGYDISELANAAGNMINIVTTAIAGAQQLANQSIDQAIEFQNLSDALNAAGDSLFKDLDAKTELFARLGLCQVVLTNLTNLGNHVDTLMKTVASKFPASGQSNDANTITHFEASFASSEDKLRACANSGPSKPTWSGLSTYTATNTWAYAGSAHASPATPTVTGHGKSATIVAQAPATTGSVYAYGTGSAYLPSTTSTFVQIGGASTVQLSATAIVGLAAVVAMVL